MNQSDLTMDVLNQGSDNYSSIDQKNHLKWNVFRDYAGSVFRYVFGISETCDFYAIFSWTVQKCFYVLGADYFVLKVFFKSFV